MNNRYKYILTYDISGDNDYDSLYELLGEYKAEEITESTQGIKTYHNFETFKEKLLKVTSKGDNVKVVLIENGVLNVKSIR